MTEHMQHVFGRKILGRIYGPIQGKEQRPSKWNGEIYSLGMHLHIVCDITFGRLGWKEEGPQKVLLVGNSRTKDG